MKKDTKRRLTSDETKAAYLLITPFYLFFAVFILIPIGSIIIYSFTNYNLYGTPEFIGLKNYFDLWSDQEFWIAMKNTFIYTFFTTFPSLILGFLAAVVLNSKAIKLVGTMRVLFYLPYIPSMVSMAIVWMWFYDPTAGVFNYLLRLFGFPPQYWLSNPKLALGCVIAVGIWQRIGYNMIIYLAALQMIPTSIYESADLDGATKLRKTWHITVPMVKQTTFFLVVVSLIRSFSVFGQVNVMTAGGPLNATTTIVHQIYLKGFDQLRFGYANAMALILLLLVTLITFANFFYGRSAHESDF